MYQRNIAALFWSSPHVRMSSFMESFYSLKTWEETMIFILPPHTYCKFIHHIPIKRSYFPHTVYARVLWLPCVKWQVGHWIINELDIFIFTVVRKHYLAVSLRNHLERLGVKGWRRHMTGVTRVMTRKKENLFCLTVFCCWMERPTAGGAWSEVDGEAHRLG